MHSVLSAPRPHCKDLQIVEAAGLDLIKKRVHDFFPGEWSYIFRIALKTKQVYFFGKVFQRFLSSNVSRHFHSAVSQGDRREWRKNGNRLFLTTCHSYRIAVEGQRRCQTFSSFPSFPARHLLPPEKNTLHIADDIRATQEMSLNSRLPIAF